MFKILTIVGLTLLAVWCVNNPEQTKRGYHRVVGAGTEAGKAATKEFQARK